MPLNPKKFNDAHRAWLKIKAEAADYLDQWDVDRLDLLFLRAGWARRPFVYRVPLDELDRCGDILSGPLFASEKHPWPVNSNGLYMLPCLQINLTECSRVMQAEYGTGMLQVWGDQEDVAKFYLRLIPRRDVTPNRCRTGVDGFRDAILRCQGSAPSIRSASEASN